MTTESLSDYIERALSDGDGAQPTIYPDYALWPLPPLDIWLVLAAVWIGVIVWLLWDSHK